MFVFAVGSYSDRGARGRKACTTFRGENLEWQKGKRIGKGAFGEVHRVVLTETGQLAAMKTIPTDDLSTLSL